MGDMQAALRDAYIRQHAQLVKLGRTEKAREVEELLRDRFGYFLAGTRIGHVDDSTSYGVCLMGELTGEADLDEVEATGSATGPHVHHDVELEDADES